MKYSLEFLIQRSLESEEGTVSSEQQLEHLFLKLDAEKFVSLALIHTNSNILTISGGRQQYVVMFSDINRIFELNNPSNKGEEPVLLRTGHSVGKFPSEMIMDPFTVMNIIREFYRNGTRLTDLNWKPLT